LRDYRDAAAFALRASGYVKAPPRQVAEPRMNADFQDKMQTGCTGSTGSKEVNAEKAKHI
jgi:hypothetical protein